MATFDIQSALKAGYSPQQVSQFMQQNGFDQQGNQIQQQMAQPAQSDDLSTMLGKGALGLLGNIIKPFIQTGKTIGGAAVEAGRAADQATGSNVAHTLGLQNDYLTKDNQTVQNPLLSEKELGNYSKNPLQAFLKQLGNSAQVASYGIPVGQGGNILKSVLAPGAAIGAVNSAGQQLADTASIDPNKVVGDTLLGAGAAGVTHGALQIPGLFSKAGNAIENAGSGLRSDVTKIQLPPSVYGASKEQTVQNTLDKLGIKGSAQQKYEQLLPQMSKLGDKIYTELTDNPKEVPISQVKSDFLGNLQDKIRTKNLSSKTAQAEINGYLSDLYTPGLKNNEPLPDTISTADLFKLKQQVNQDYQGVAKKLQNGTPLNPREQVVAAARQTLDDIIAKEHPTVKQATQMQSHLYDAASSLADARNSNHAVSVMGIPIPSEVASRVKDNAGKVLQDTGKMVQGGNKIRSGIANPALATLLEQGAARLPAMLNSQEPANNIDPNSGKNNSENNSDNNAHKETIAQPEQNSNMRITPQQVAAASLYLPQPLADRVKAAYQAQYGGLNPQQVEAQKGLSNVADDLSQKIANSNVSQGNILLNHVLGSFGKGDPKVQELEAEAASFNQAIATELHRRGIGDQQMQQLSPFLLQPGKDSPQQMQSKIQAIKGMLQNYFPNTEGGAQ